MAQRCWTGGRGPRDGGEEVSLSREAGGHGAEVKDLEAVASLSRLLGPALDVVTFERVGCRADIAAVPRQRKGQGDPQKVRWSGMHCLRSGVGRHCELGRVLLRSAPFR